MKAWVLHNPNDLRFEKVKKPALRDGEVLVEVKACGICGSDIPRIFKTGAHRHPLIPGHEFSGRVVETFDSESEWIGRSVGVFPMIPCGGCEQCRDGHVEMCLNYNYLGSRCDGGFAEYVAVPEENLIELPGNVSFEAAAMIEPMAVAVHAIRRANIYPDDIVMVIGLGTIGLLTSMFLKAMGFEHIIAVGNKEVQKQMARKIGLNDDAYHGFRNIPKADVIFECVGKNETYSKAVESALPGGRIVTVGNPAGEMKLEKDIYWSVLRNQLTITGTWNSSFLHRSDDDWNYVVKMLGDELINPEIFITHRFKIDQLMAGFEIMRDKSQPYIKVIMER